MVLVAAAGFLPLAAGQWLLPALPGMVVNLVARADSMQAVILLLVATTRLVKSDIRSAR